MKALHSYILEAVDNELKQQLLDIINDESFTDASAHKMLNSIVDVEDLKDYFKEHGIDDDIKNIVRLLRENDDIQKVMLIAKSDHHTLPTGNDFVENTNIYDLIRSHCGENTISEDSMKELAAEKPSKNSITRGGFEILACMFLGDILSGNKGKCDVNTRSALLEFKTPGARVKSQKEHPANKIDMTMFAEFSKLDDNLKESDFTKIMSSQKSIQSLNKLIKNINIDDDSLFDILFKSLCAQYDGNGYKDIDFKHKKEIVTNGKIDPKALIRLMGCIQLYNYAFEESWGWMVIFNGDTGAGALQRGEYTCISKAEAMNVNAIFADKNITFKNGGNGYGSARDHYCQITHK